MANNISAFPSQSDAPASGPLMSEDAVRASRGMLEKLSTPAADHPGDGSMEVLLLEMLRPMLGARLDAALPEAFERAVAREVTRREAGSAPAHASDMLRTS